MKKYIFAFTLCALSHNASAQNFSDKVDVVSDIPSGSYHLDSAPYPNTVIGRGHWEIVADPFTTISSLNIEHYIFLFGTGSLESITVYGSAFAEIGLVINSGSPTEQSFTGIGIQPGEYFFELSGYNLNQGGSTLVSGFDLISTIKFTGSYSVIPEPASAGAFLGALSLGVAFICRRSSRKSIQFGA